ncbi:MAG: carboxymuconolactone decarboxylase family protein [Acidimicrobiales bacterium]
MNGGDAVADQALIPMLAPGEAQAVAEEAKVPGALAELNIFRLLLRRPRLAKGTAELLLSLLFGAELDAGLRELIIMRVAWVSGSDYEWAQHWRIATDLGVTEADLVGVRDWRVHGAFGPEQIAVLRAVDEVSADGSVSPEAVADLVRLLGEEAALEAVTAIGAWSMISIVLRSLEVPLEAGVADWPPDGRVPRQAR